MVGNHLIIWEDPEPTKLPVRTVRTAELLLWDPCPSLLLYGRSWLFAAVASQNTVFKASGDEICAPVTKLLTNDRMKITYNVI